MKNNPSIDILLASYNGQRYIGLQIDSILGQSNKDWQLLIRDDVSDDNTPQIIADYAARYPDKIKWVDNEGQHLGACLNFGKLLDISTAKYIMFSDQDDIWLPKKIEATFSLMKTVEQKYPTKPILVHTDLKVVDMQLNTIAASMWKYQNNRPQNGDKLDKVISQNVATGCTMMINSEAKAVSMPIPAEAVMHDWWIAINTAKHGKIAYLPQQLVLYRQHGGNAVGAKQNNILSLKKRTTEYFKMVKKYDPDAQFWQVVSKKIITKVTQKIV
jgi:glycosyltransferase involved in cell wall biosynthesis